jgi:hypothetical protein
MAALDTEPRSIFLIPFGKSSKKPNYLRFAGYYTIIQWIAENRKVKMCRNSPILGHYLQKDSKSNPPPPIYGQGLPPDAENTEPENTKFDIPIIK